MSRYHWVITQDLITQDDVGVFGPSGATLTAEQIREHPQAVDFQLRDPDGEVYYHGRYVGPDDETLFAPLDDFGMPNAGCVDIGYRNALGAWDWI